jgi:hypothetical protein
VTAWKPPVTLEVSIFDILARELASGRFGSGKVKAAVVIKALPGQEQELFKGSSKEQSEPI